MESVATQTRRDIPDEEAISEAETLLTDAVSQRMIADVPLGALLSGGLDSSLIAAIANMGQPTASRT